MRNETTVSKWGNSLAVRIPQAVAKEARLKEAEASVGARARTSQRLEIELVQRQRAISRAGHGCGHVAGMARTEPFVESAGIGIREELDDTRTPPPRFVERAGHQGPANPAAVRGGLDPHVFQAPARPAILERAHPDNRAIPLRDPHVVRFEIAGDDRELRIPLARKATVRPPASRAAV